MNKTLLNKIIYIVTSLLFLALGIFGISRLHLHSGLPYQIERKGSEMLISGILPDKITSESKLMKGDRLVKIDNFSIQSGREIDFVLDNVLPGDKVDLIVQRGEAIFSVSQAIIPRFTQRFIIINLLLGLLFWIVGIFVYLNKPLDKATRTVF